MPLSEPFSVSTSVVDSAEVALCGGGLTFCHGAEVRLEKAETHNHYYGKQGVEIKGYGCRHGADARGEKVAVLGERGDDGGAPAGDGGDDAYGGGCGVDEVSRLCPRNLVAVGYRLHDRADGEAVAVVVDEDESAESRRCKRSSPAAFELSVHQLAVGFGAARPCDYHDEGAHRGEKDDDVDVESVAHELNSVFKGVDKGVLTHATV